MQLYNKLSAQEISEMLEKTAKKRITLSFYKYAHIENPRLFRDYLFLSWNPLEVLGRIYVAKEGINAQLSLPTNQIEAFKTHLNTISFLKGVRLNIAIEHNLKSFLKLTIKVRKKIVADGLVDDKFDVTKKGIHLNAIEFNNLLDHKNTICVDMRNHYESEIGHFKNAICPDVDTFRDSLDIIEDKLKDHRIVFVGDRIPFPGNDYALAEALRKHPNGEAIEVDCWQDTAALLKTDLFASG